MNTFTDWHVERLADGVGIFPPDGRVGGAIRIRDRRRPVCSLREIADRVRAELKLANAEISPIERVITGEGEYAGLVTIAGTHDELRFERTLGAIYGDDFYTLIDGGTARHFETFRAAVRELVSSYALGLGELRRRRVLYVPPLDWIGCSRGLITDWYPPGFPNQRASISVFAARPLVETSTLDRVLHELTLPCKRAGMSCTVEALSTRKLAGIVVRATGTDDASRFAHQDIAVLRDERFSYVVKLESGADARAAAVPYFEGLVESIEPLPRPESANVSSAAMLHWAE